MWNDPGIDSGLFVSCNFTVVFLTGPHEAEYCHRSGQCGTEGDLKCSEVCRVV